MEDRLLYKSIKNRGNPCARYVSTPPRPGLFTSYSPSTGFGPRSFTYFGLPMVIFFQVHFCFALYSVELFPSRQLSQLVQEGEILSRESSFFKLGLKLFGYIV